MGLSPPLLELLSARVFLFGSRLHRGPAITTSHQWWGDAFEGRASRDAEGVIGGDGGVLVRQVERSGEVSLPPAESAAAKYTIPVSHSCVWDSRKMIRD